MNKKMMNGTILRRALVLCLCAALAVSAAAAETAGKTVDLANTAKREAFLDYCVLPDGRLVFAGYREDPETGEGCRGRLLCLNPDRTVCWEYEEEKLSCFSGVVVTADGRLAVANTEDVRFFTPEGQPDGKPLFLPQEDDRVYALTPAGLIRGQRTERGIAESMELAGWDGSTLFRADEPESMWAWDKVIAEEDGLVLCGRKAGEPSEAAPGILKIDLQGNTVWETQLSFLTDRRDNAGVTSAVRTADGGYLAVLWEYIRNPGTGETDTRALVRLDAGGNLLWTKRTDSALWDVVEYGGKIVAYDRDPEDGEDQPCMRYLWLDAEGNPLGWTRLPVGAEETPAYSDSGRLSVTGEGLIPMADGLWQLLCFWEMDDPEDPETAWTQQDFMLVRVPEL